MRRIFLIFGIVYLFGMTKITALGQPSKHRADQIIRDICDRLNEDDLYSDENIKWYSLCQEWIDEQKQEETIMDESYLTHIHRSRRARVRLSSLRSFRGFRSRSSIRSSSGSRSSSSSIVRFHNIHTGARILRPQGWQWSRAGSIFLPLSRHFHHRYHSQNNQFTTLASSTETYYYCTSAKNESIEIQCSTTHGDSQCCEDEVTEQIFCCGGKISADWIKEANCAVQILARVFYTLVAVTLCVHVFRRRFSE